MAATSALRKELDILKREKSDAQRRNHAQAVTYRRTHTDDQTGVEGSDEPAIEAGNRHESVPDDPLDWTAAQWARFDRPPPQSATSGYKNMTGLAHATYAKETAKRPVDLEKYEQSKQRGSGPSPVFDSRPAAENVDSLVKSLHEASARKQKRRTDSAADKQYVNEKNRQFNMKLDREYGKTKEKD